MQRMEERSTTYRLPDEAENYYEGKEDVSETIKLRLMFANQAIIYARTKLHVGAGNINRQIEDSNNLSYALANESGKWAQTIVDKIGTIVVNDSALEEPGLFKFGKLNSEKKPVFEKINWAAARAIASRKFGAGVCDDFSSVVFFYLKKNLPKWEETDIYHISLTIKDAKHAAVLLANSDFNLDDKGTWAAAVVVDAWPTHAFAILLEDWRYRNYISSINFFGASVPSKEYLSKVRDVWRKPYQYQEELSYRRLGDFGGEGSDAYTKHFKVAVESFKKSPTIPSKNPWSTLWDDDNSL